MALFGRIRRRLALALLLTALIPLLAAVLLAASMLRQATARFYVPEVGVRLDQSLSLYQELARAVKTSMRLAGTAIAAREPLRQAARTQDAAALRRELERAMQEYPQLVSLTVYDADDRELARADRGHPLDPAKENKLEVVRSLSEAEKPAQGVAAEATAEPDDEDSAAGTRLVAVFAADKARFEELGQMSQFVDTYKQLERRRVSDESSYVYAFALLLGITIIAAIGLGALLAQSVSSRLGELSLATQRVAAGDLSIRVPEYGKDEISDLAKAFNRMLGEVENSRARIEYLQRIAAWQEMARRLAHEIKNPLTPIQLAVQEIHRRYPGGDPAYQKLLDSTREIVEDEVLTLRRLVSEFSGFARLPQAELERADLGDFLKEQSLRLAMPDDEEAAGDELPERADGTRLWEDLKLDFDIPSQPAPVFLDRHMFRRALINLVRNAAQAIHGAGRSQGVIAIRLGRNGDYHVLDIDDDGPGVPPELGSAVFDPYVTTKNDGTGLGLAIVKKIVVEHGGTIAAQSSPLGGARMRILLPVLGTKASAALQQRDWQQTPPSSSRAVRRPLGRAETT